ncbi:Chromosome partitioning protein ParB (plasmid) [Pararobbsia alpina]|uniref:ParB-like protein n=1 Tax=Pararobbsia alpina TaxID=621374 RepID=UPI0039A6CA7B
MDARLDQLRPTQAVYGLKEVQQKAQEYERLGEHDLQMAIAEKPIPVVLGPDDRLYVIDNHHVAAALWSIAVESVPYVLELELSKCSFSDFWLQLEDRKWTHPYDKDGRRIAFQDMPETLVDMQDDDFRSLAAAVRDRGGFENTGAALAEFRWADFFRARIQRPSSDAEFASAIRAAMNLAKSKEARGLPGYLG